MSDTDRARDAALKAIRDAARSGAAALHLSGPAFAALDTLPGEISTLTALTDLDLSGTAVGDLSPLRSLTALQTLVLDGTPVSDLAPLTPMRHLTALMLHNTRTASLAPLSGMTTPEMLTLDNTPVRDLTPLAGMTALRLLWLRGTAISDIAPLAGLTALETLDIRRTNVADLRPLADLPFPPRSRDPGEPPPGLHILDCRACRSDPEGLGRLSEIRDDEERTRAILGYLKALPGAPTFPV